MIVQVILGTVCLYRLYWGHCVCTGYTGDRVFVQVILGTVCLYRLYWGQCDCTGYTGDSVIVQVILGTVCLYRLYWGQCDCTGYTGDSVIVQVILFFLYFGYILLCLCVAQTKQNGLLLCLGYACTKREPKYKVNFVFKNLPKSDSLSNTNVLMHRTRLELEYGLT